MQVSYQGMKQARTFLKVDSDLSHTSKPQLRQRLDGKR